MMLILIERSLYFKIFQKRYFQSILYINYNEYLQLKRKQREITKEEFASFSIAVPPIDEQQRIVDVLDKFHNLCHDISEGLPAEIEARKKQYAFYRDKLLSFKETPTYEQKKEISKTE